MSLSTWSKPLAWSPVKKALVQKWSSYTVSAIITAATVTVYIRWNWNAEKAWLSFLTSPVFLEKSELNEMWHYRLEFERIIKNVSYNGKLCYTVCQQNKATRIMIFMIVLWWYVSMTDWKGLKWSWLGRKGREVLEGRVLLSARQGSKLLSRSQSGGERERCSSRANVWTSGWTEVYLFRSLSTI